MTLKTIKWVPLCIAVAVIGLVCLLQVLRPGFVEHLEWLTYDWRLRQAANSSPPIAANLGYVVINDESITAVRNGELGYQFGLYWPRSVYGSLVRELAAQGAKAVAFDVIFGEMRADHPSVPVEDPSLLATDQMFGRKLDRFKDKTLLQSDDFFAWQMKKAGNVILAETKSITPPDLFRTNALAMGNIDAETDADGILRRARAFTFRWHPVFRSAGKQLGVDLDKSIVEQERIILHLPGGEDTSIPLDEDGNFDLADFVGDKIPNGWARRARPFERVWHMGIVLAARELDLDLANAEVNLERGRIVLSGPAGLERMIPVDRDGYFYIDWMLRREDERLQKQNIIAFLKQDRDRLAGRQPDFATGWKNKLVIVGSTATGHDLADLGATPLDKETILMSKHWNVANSVITGRFIRRSSLAAELMLIMLAGSLVALLTWNLRSITAALAMLALAVGYTALAQFVFVHHLYWLPLVLPIIGAILVQYICLVTYRTVFEQDEKQRIKSVFSRIVSPYVVNELLKSDKLSLSARREISVLFTDVRGFTELTDASREVAADYVRTHRLSEAEAQDCFDEHARETLSIINLYLGTIVDLVIKHNGTLDKYIGDCVMAFWGAPIADPNHALSCVRAAVEAQRAVHELNHQRTLENERRTKKNAGLAAAGQALLPMLPILMVGSGINSGVATVGLMGSDRHGLNYTVFGREVNLASRLENLSGRGRIIIGEATYAALVKEDPQLAAACLALPPQKVKGIRETVNSYEVPWQPINQSLSVDGLGNQTRPVATPNAGLAGSS